MSYYENIKENGWKEAVKLKNQRINSTNSQNKNSFQKRTL